MAQTNYNDSDLARHRWVKSTIQRHVAGLRDEADSWRLPLLAYWSRWGQADGIDGTFDDLRAEDHPMLVGINYLYAFVDSLVAAVVPNNPKVNVVPSSQAFEPPAEARELLLNTVWRRQRLESKLRKATARAAMFGRCWLKQTWDAGRTMPKYRVVRPHNVYFDDSVTEYEDIRYIGEVVPLTRGQFESRCAKRGRKNPLYHLSEEDLDSISYSGYPSWMTDDNIDEQGEVNRANYQWITVYEHYDFVANKYYHFVDGLERPIYEGPLPYRLLKNPFVLVTFNDNLVNVRGLGDAALIYPTLEQLNTMATLENWHTRLAIPVPVILENLLDDPEAFVEQFRQVKGPDDVLRLAARPNVSVSDVIGSTPVTQLPIEWQAIRGALVTAIELVTGMPGFMRGTSAGADVATTDALRDEHYNDRNNVRRRILYDAAADLAQGSIGLYLEYLSEDKALPLRSDNGSYTKVDRRVLGFGEMLDGGEVSPDDPWDYQYDLYPYNAAEQNDLVLLKRAFEAMPMAIQNPEINQTRLFAWFFGLLGAPKSIFNSDQEKQAAMAALAPAASEATPESSALPADATGPQALAQVAGGQVEGVSGPQSASAGFESATPT